MLNCSKCGCQRWIFVAGASFSSNHPMFGVSWGIQFWPCSCVKRWTWRTTTCHWPSAEHDHGTHGKAMLGFMKQCGWNSFSTAIGSFRSPKDFCTVWTVLVAREHVHYSLEYGISRNVFQEVARALQGLQAHQCQSSWRAMARVRASTRLLGLLDPHSSYGLWLRYGSKHVKTLVPCSSQQNGCVWKCRVPHCTQWFCWSLSLY